MEKITLSRTIDRSSTLGTPGAQTSGTSQSTTLTVTLESDTQTYHQLQERAFEALERLEHETRTRG